MVESNLCEGHVICNLVSLIFVVGDKVSVRRVESKGYPSDSHALFCVRNQCGFTGFLMKPSA